MKIEQKHYMFKISFAQCPYCKKTTERVGVFETKKENSLIGFIGLDCKFCGKREKADINNIDEISDVQKKLL